MRKEDTVALIDESNKQPNNPLHGLTLENILKFLVANYGWKEMNRKVELNCFFSHPSIKSSLIFLRKNHWARLKVEAMYLELVQSMKSPEVDDKEPAGGVFF